MVISGDHKDVDVIALYYIINEFQGKLPTDVEIGYEKHRNAIFSDANGDLLNRLVSLDTTNLIN